MKKDKKFFICAMLVLTLFLCVSASSAAEPLDQELGADIGDELAVSDVSNDELSASGDTFVVDGIGEGGNYKTISDAVSAATGGETIFIKDGNYTETSQIAIGAKQLTFTGESQDGVIIKSGNNKLFETTTSGYNSLIFNSLTFKDIQLTGGNMPINIGGDGNVTITDCTFDNCASRYGAIRIFTSGSVLIDNCKFLNTQSSTGSYSSAIGFGGSSTSDYVINNTIIDGSSISTASTATYIFGAIYNQKTAGTVTLDNVIIRNCNLDKASGLIATTGNMNIKRSKFVNNYVYRDLAIAGFIFVSGAKAVTIESSLIANNTDPNYILTANSASASFDLNYNNIQNNTFKTAFNNTDGTYTLEANYWGSNDLPVGITANTWVVEDNGEYKLNTGDALAKEIPLINEKEPSINDVYVSVDGTGDGLSKDTPMSDFNQAVQIVADKGTIHIANGEYTIANSIKVNKSVSFVGESRDGVKLNCTAAAGEFLIGQNEDITLDSVSFSKITFVDCATPIIYSYVAVDDLTINNCIFNATSGPLVQVGIDYAGDKNLRGTLNFKKNVVTSDKCAIKVLGKYDANINDNIFFTENSNDLIFNYTQGAIDAEYNYWGSNVPATALDITNYIIVNAGANVTEIYNDEEAKILVNLTLNDGTTSAKSYLPDYAITAELSGLGNFTEKTVTVKNGVGQAIYSNNVAGDYDIDVEILNQTLTVPITVVERYVGIVYVSKEGNDTNNGSFAAPVASIGKAVEIANKGSHEIIISEGTYVGNGYHVTDNLTVTGVGKVTLDANDEGRFFYMNYGDTADKIELSNLILTNSNGYGAAVYSNADELILDNVTIVNTQATGYLISSRGKLTIKDSNITNSAAGDVIKQSGSGDVFIKNTVFENNNATDGSSVYAIIDLDSGSGNLVVEDSTFINNTVKQGVIRGYSTYNIYIKGSEFIDNDNMWDGGAIYAYTYDCILDITDSAFINNKAGRNGGAIYVGWKTTANIDKSAFINNSVTGSGYHGDAIYNNNNLTVSNSILLTNANDYIIYNADDDDVATAQDNWWGTNRTPEGLVGTGVDVSNWVTMDASYTPTTVYPGDELTITATFSNTNIPDGIPVTFTSTNGNLDIVVLTEDGIASTTYIIGSTDENITVSADNVAIDMPLIFAQSVIVTNDTFYSFFDEDGVLRNNVTATELVFLGEFSDISDYVIIDKAITITGHNAVLNNIGFVVVAEDVSLDNLTLIATTSLGDLINVGASNVNLTNLDLSYDVGDEYGNAISVSSDKTISNVNILNNTIYFESHTETDEELVTAINLVDVEDVTVDGNDITADIPSLSVETYDDTYFMMGLCYVNPIRVYEAEASELTNNNVNVIVNSYDKSYPTVQSLYIVGSEDILVKGNNFTMRDDLTPKGTSIYLYAVECGFSEGIEFIENNFDISTTGGKSGAGSAYALQVATSEATFIGNNITCDSNGPNLGIYSPYGFGPAKNLTIKENFINVTGYAAGTSTDALVSGIEVQTGYATIYNNTIYVQNKEAYNEKYPVAGVSAVQYSAKTLSFDIQDNEIYTNGKYTVDIRYAPTEGIVVGNYLLSNELQGDKSVYFKSGNNNIVENNTPTNVVTNDTFFNFFDNEGVLLSPNVYKELIFNGTFSDLTDMIVINAPISIVGVNATLNDIAVRVISDKVKLSDLTLNSNNKEYANNNGALIYATGSNIEISDVAVNYVAPSDVEAIGIYANAADNFTLTNSEIVYVATNPGSKHNYGLEVRDSENVSIEGNTINATLPAVNVVWSGSGIDQDLVLGVGIQGGKNINFTENNVNVRTNGGVGSYPTIDAIMIHSVDNVLVNLNNITHIDTMTVDTARYYYSVDIYSSTGTVDSNNILLNTTSGAKTGTAYPVQLTGPFTVTVSNNNLTSISRGPNAGIYAANWNGFGDLTVIGNTFDITGNVTATSSSPVAGIEAEIDVTRVYENTIKVTNLADYNDTNPSYGVSMVSIYVSNPAADIRWNNITVDGKYAVYYREAANTNITFNELLAHDLEGNDAAFIASGDNNYIDVNFPPYLPKIIIEANDTWIGNDVAVDVTVVNTTGNVTIKVNEKEFKDLVLVDGKVSQLVLAADLVAGINNVTVTFTSTDTNMRPGSENSTFWVLNGVVTQDTYRFYFNQEDNGKLADCVPEGATLDFQGSIINPDTNIIVQMNVNKPVNIVSTTKDAYVDLNTTAGSLLGESPGNSFAVTRGGSGSNVTGIYFHNTQIWISNTTNVVLDNISVVVEDQRVGSGVGATSIRDNSSNVVLKNSYLYTRNNGGSTTFTMSWTDNCTIDNCTLKAEGNVGNLLYLNAFNIVGAPTGVPLNTNNKAINNRIYGKEGSSISVGIMVEGQNNTFENNTLYKCSVNNIFGTTYEPYYNIYTGNVLTEGGSLTAQQRSIVYNNNVTGSLTTGKGSVVYNNTVGKSMTVTAGDANVKTTAYNNTVATSMSVGADTVAYDNIVGTTMSVAARAVAHDNKVGTSMTVSGANAVAYDNTIGTTLSISAKNTVVKGNDIAGAVTIAKAATNTTFVGNNVNATVTVNSNDNNIKDNTIITDGEYAIDLKTATGNTVTDNFLVSNSYNGDAAVKYTGENNIEENEPQIEITVVADAVWIGSNGTVVVNVVNGTGNVTIKFNDKEYIVDLDENGTATKVIPAEELAAVNNVTVAYQTAGFLPVSKDAVLAVLDGVITNETYKYYFDESGNLASGVPNGVTLDFQGLFLGNFPVYIDKSVNVVSSTGDALFDCGATYKSNAVNSFNIVAGGDNTNITGLDFINYCLYIKGASNVTVDNISIVANKRGVGSGTGFLSIHTGAYNTLVKNGYFENGGTGSSLLVLGKGGAYAVFDHNVFNITGSSGNILSANQFVGSGAAPEHVSYTNNVLYNSQPGSAFCYAMTVSGSGNLVENNTIYHNGSGILNQYGATSSGNVYRNNTLYGNTNFNPSANSIVENNKIYAKTTNIAANTTAVNNIFVNVAISGTNTTFVNNDVTGTVTVSGNENTINANTIVSAGDYAVDLKSTVNNTVTGNYLESSSYYGDAAVKYTGENIVEDNDPRVHMDVVADAVWIGTDGTVVVNVVNGTGNVTIKFNDKEYIVDLDENGTATKVIPAEELAAVNNVTVAYETAGFLPVSEETVLAVLDGVITNETYKYYFDEEGNLASGVPNGVTLDFQGLFLGNFPVYIDKSVNVVSSTGDALFDCGATYKSNAVNSFNIVAGGDNTNITGLDFINYCLYIKGASNVTVDNISIVANKRGVGSGTGFLSIHTGAYNTLVKNGYFENGGTGSSLLVLGKGGAYAVFDHNVFNITGSSGNILSANQFVGSGAAPEHVSYTNNVLYNSQPGSAFCYAMTVSGSGNLVENNTIYHNGSGILNQYGATSSGNVYRNNTLYGNTNFNPSANSIVEDNKIYATTTNIAANTTVVNNVFKNVAISGTNTTFANNDVTGTVTVNGNDNRIEDNTIISTGDYAVDLKSTTGNNVTGNYLISKVTYGQNAVSAKDNESAIIENNRPADPEILIDVEDITVVEDAVINININENATGIANVIVDGKSYPVDIVDGFGNLTVSDLPASDYTVTVEFESDIISGWSAANSTTFNVAKLDSEISIAISETQLGNDTTVSVSVPGATGNVTIIVNGKEETIPLDEDGNATYTIEDISAGDYDVTVIYSGDKEHSFAYNTTAFTVDKLESEITVDVTGAKVGENATVRVNVTEGATGVVIVFVGDDIYAIDLAEGNAVEFAIDVAGNYTVSAGYTGDDKYAESFSDNVTLEITEKADANVKVEIPEDVKVGDKIIINITADTDAAIVVYINGEAQPFLLQSGSLGVSVMDVMKFVLDKKVAYYVSEEGIYNVTVVASENENYAGEVVTKVFEATKKDAVLEIVPVTDAKVNDTITISVVNETDGALTIKVNGEEVTGDYLITKAGTYTITVQSAETDTYNAGFAESTFEVPEPVIEKINTTIDASAKVNGHKVTISVAVNENATGLVSMKLGDNVLIIPLTDGTGSYIAEFAAGSYSADLTYLGDDYFNENSTKVSFIVVDAAKENTAIAIDVVTDEDKAYFTVTVDKDATGLVKFDLTGAEEYVLYADVIDGEAYFYDILTTGDYTVVATYMGDDRFNTNITTESFTVKGHVKVDTTIDASANVNGHKVTISVAVNENATGYVSMKLGDNVVIIPLADGTGSYVADFLAGSYSADLTYLGDDDFNENSTSVDFTVVDTAKENTTIAIDVITVEDKAYFTVYVNENATGLVKFDLTGAEEYVLYADVVGGEAYFYDILTTGDYTVVATYMGDDRFNTNITTESFTVKGHVKENTSIDASANVNGHKVTITVTVDKDATGFVSMKLGDNVVIIPLADGTGSYVADFLAGSYSADLTYLGDDDFNENSTSVDFTVVDTAKENTTIAIDVVTDEDKAYFTVYVDKDATGLVKFDLTGPEEYVLYADVVGGEAYFYDILTTGDYTVVATYMGDDRFNTNITTESFTVKGHVKENTSIDASANVNGHKVTITVSVDEDATGFVSMKLGDNVIIIPLVDGIGTYTNDFASGSYSAVLTYLGDDDFNENSTRVLFTVIDVAKENTEISVDVDVIKNDAVFTVIVNENATGIVKFEIAGENAVYVDVIDGKAVIDGIFENGDYTVVATYMGDDRFNTNVTSSVFTIDVPETEVTNATINIPSDIKAGDNATVDVVIPNATGNVTVIVDGKETVVALENGTASVPIENVTAGDHSVVVIYSGDETHAPTYNATSFEVSAEPVVIPKASEFGEITIGDDLNISIVLKDSDGNAIANAPITYSVNGVANTVTTDAEGKFVIAGENGAVININYAGNENFVATNTTLTLNNATVPVVVKVASHFDIENRAITINGYAVDTAAGEHGIFYATTLLDADGNPISNAYIEFAVNNKIYNRTTYENGSFKPYQLDMIRAGRYTMAFNFAGDDNYTNAFACVCVDLDKKPIKIKASNKSYKASTKTKKYTVKLSTIVGSSHDGKVHMKSGMKVTLTVNGKTYTGKTNGKGQVTFKITNLKKKGKYTAKIYYKGDKTYEEAEKSVKLTIK